MVEEMVFKWTKTKEISELRKVVTEKALSYPFLFKISLTLASVNYFIFSEFISEFISYFILFKKILHHFHPLLPKLFFVFNVHSNSIYWWDSLTSIPFYIAVCSPKRCWICVDHNLCFFNCELLWSKHIVDYCRIMNGRLRNIIVFFVRVL